MGQVELRELLQHAAQVLSWLSGAAFVGGIILSAVRSELRGVPCWWWLWAGVTLVLAGLGNDIDWFQATLLVAGAFSLGIGAAMAVVEYRAGRIRFGRKWRPSTYDLLANQDWVAGTRLIHLLDVIPHFNGLMAENPYLDFKIRLISLSVHGAYLQPGVTGRMQLPNERDTFEALIHPPELQDFSVQKGTTSTTQQIAGAEIKIERNQDLSITIRQHVLPAVRDRLVSKAGTDVQFRFDPVDVGVVFTRWEPERRVERRTRERLPLGTYPLKIPDYIKTST